MIEFLFAPAVVIIVVVIIGIIFQPKPQRPYWMDSIDPDR